MSTSLYRKYRPSKFSDLIGQDHVSLALQNAMSENRLSHAYLFSGTRGTGKTSTARILGAVLNCEKFKDGFGVDAKLVEPCGECDSCLSAKKGSSFDVIELDAASNNGVEDMRDLIEKVSYSSAGGGQKVYIIDEVHELTGRAANTLLKTLEEPPEHVVFILATTNPEKVLPTIRSRTQHFEFKTVEDEVLARHVKQILELESKDLDDGAIDYVVRKGAGSVRDTLSFLDQILAQDVSTLEQISSANGSNNDSIISDLILASATKDVTTIFDSLGELITSGKEPRAIVENIIAFSRDCLVLSLNPETKVLLSGSVAKDEMKNLGEKCGTQFLTNFIVRMGKSIADMRGTASINPLLTLEIALLDSVNGEVKMPSNSQSATSPALRDRSEVAAANHQPSAVQKVAVPRPVSQKPEIREEVKAEKPATLGALKRSAPVKSLEQEKEIDLTTDEDVKPQNKKISIAQVKESWPKVLMVLSPASQVSIKKTEPIEVENDVLTFGVNPEDIEEVKTRFKKDATIIRGCLESQHEQIFRFKIIPTEISLVNKSLNEDKELEESIEYDPINHVLDKFGGEIIPE